MLELEAMDETCLVLVCRPQHFVSSFVCHCVLSMFVIQIWRGQRAGEATYGHMITYSHILISYTVLGVFGSPSTHIASANKQGKHTLCLTRTPQ